MKAAIPTIQPCAELSGRRNGQRSKDLVVPGGGNRKMSERLTIERNVG
jgi:hypothetical protein